MELTERERRILAELERQFPAGESAHSAGTVAARPARQGVRPQWTVLPSTVLGVGLLVAGILLGVIDAVLTGVLLLGWSSSPWLLRGTRRLCVPG